MKKFVKAILPILLVISAVVGISYYAGIPFRHIEYERCVYWPDEGYGEDEIHIWHWAKIVYSDQYDWHPSNRDSLHKVHLKMAQDFKEP